MSESPLDTSVIIPSFEDRGHLRDIIEALQAQQPPVKEIIVSHSGSGDSWRHLPDGPVPVRLLHQDEQLFSGAARNVGAATASGSWLAFLDDDVIPAPDWTANLSSAQQRTQEQTCFVGSMGADRSGGYWGMCLWFVEFGSVHPYMPGRPVESGASANMFLPRALYDRAGGFPDRVNRSVDAEFMGRCRASGGRTRFIDSVKVFHRNIAGFKHCMQHIATIGGGSARVRKMARLRGSVFVDWPLLIPLLVPGRFALMAFRVLRWGGGLRLPFLWYAPGILLALVAWETGFFRSATCPRGEPCKPG